MIINESNLNEARTIEKNGKQYYQYNGKCYERGYDGKKKEISKDQYDKIVNGKKNVKAKNKNNPKMSKNTPPEFKSYYDFEKEYGNMPANLVNLPDGKDPQISYNDETGYSVLLSGGSPYDREEDYIEVKFSTEDDYDDFNVFFGADKQEDATKLANDIAKDIKKGKLDQDEIIDKYELNNEWR